MESRNPIILHGGDIVLRMMLFWSLFLPLGARWSADEDNPSRVAEISSAPGAADALISALAATTQQGFAGLEREIAAQCASIDFDRIACPVRIYVGRDDLVCPPAMAHWLAARIDNATVTESDGGHFFALRDWANLISLAADLR